MTNLTHAHINETGALSVLESSVMQNRKVTIEYYETHLFDTDQTYKEVVKSGI